MRSKKRTAVDPSLQKSRKQATRFSPRLAAKKKLEEEEVLQNAKNKELLMQEAFCIVFQQEEEPMHWSDALALGSTCTYTHSLWKQHENKYLSPLLNLLESMVGDGEECDECDYDHDKTILRSALLDEKYISFSITEKCDAMVACLRTMVGNLQSFDLCLEDPTNTAKNKLCRVKYWYLGDEYESETKFISSYVHRSTLAMIVAIFTFALDAMAQGGSPYFNDILTGESGARLYSSSSYRETISSHLIRMLPLRNKDLAWHMRSAYPSLKNLALLGPALTEKVVLMAPFFRWVPPAADKTDLSAVRFRHLPTLMEPMNEGVCHQNELEQYWER